MCPKNKQMQWPWTLVCGLNKKRGTVQVPRKIESKDSIVTS